MNRRAGWAMAIGVVGALAWFQRGRLGTALGVLWRSAYAGNFGGVRTVPVDQIVIHTTEGTLKSAISWFAIDHSKWGMGPSSAHYVVGRDGSITGMVPEDRIAWHAGNRAVNARAIGIELEDTTPGAAGEFPAAMLGALVRLTAELVQRHKIPVQRSAWNAPGIIGHEDVPNQTHEDPGPDFPWSEYLSRVRAETRGIA